MNVSSDSHKKGERRLAHRNDTDRKREEGKSQQEGSKVGEGRETEQGRTRSLDKVLLIGLAQCIHKSA